MSEKLESIVKFLHHHRAKFAVGVTASAFLLLMYRNARELEKFMKDHNLMDEYNKWLLDED